MDEKEKIIALRQQKKVLKAKKNAFGRARKEEPVVDAAFKAMRDSGKPWKP
jgi:hypothetical protein